MSDEDQDKSLQPAQEPELPPPPPLIKPMKPSMWSNIRSSFLAGVVVIAPAAITGALIYWFVTGPMTQLDTFVRRVMPAVGDEITRAIPGFGVLVAILAIIGIGFFAKNFVGRAFIKAGEELLDATPIVRTLYRFFKNVFETALQQSGRSFKEVALVEYPRPGAWVMAFVVGETRGEIRHQLVDQGDALTSVFVPTVPNPTSGFLLFVPRAALRPLKMSVEDAAKTIFSLGLVIPEFTDPDDAIKKLQEITTQAETEKKTRRSLFSRPANTNKPAYRPDHTRLSRAEQLHSVVAAEEIQQRAQRRAALAGKLRVPLDDQPRVVARRGEQFGVNRKVGEAELRKAGLRRAEQVAGAAQA
jgi:uncharacterized membrane protein